MGRFYLKGKIINRVIRSGFSAGLTSAILMSTGLLLTLFIQGNATAAINSQINFQGKIVNNTGSTNIADGTYNMEFKIYSGGDGVVGGGDETLLWTESRLKNNSQGVVITNGIFQVNLGSVNATLASSVDFDNSTLWLTTNLGNTNATCTPFSSCVPDGEMSPMVRFTAAPYAFNSDKLDGLDSAAFGQLTSNQTWTGINSFSTDMNLNFLATENLAVTSDLAGTVDVISIITTPSSTAGTAQGLFIQQANSANTNGLDSAITIDNADTDMVIGAAIKILNSGGTGFYTAIIDNQGTLISGPELNVLDGGISLDEVYTADSDKELSVNTATGLVFDMTSTGDFIIQDSNTTIATFSNVGAITFAPTSGEDVILNFAGNGRLDINPVNYENNLGAIDVVRTGDFTGVAAETANELRFAPGLTLAEPASGTFTWNGANIDMSGIAVTAGAGTTVLNGMRIKGVSDADAGTVNGLLIDNLTGTAAVENAINIGTGWDTVFGGTTAGTNLFSFTNFTVTSAGALTAVGLNSGSGLIQGTGGVTVSGNATLAATGGNTVSLGNATGAVTVTGNSSSTFVLNAVTVDATEFNRLNGTTAALVDQDDFIASDGAGATSSGSGLEAGTGGIGLIQGCSDGQVLKWNEASSIWECNSDRFTFGMALSDDYTNATTTFTDIDDNATGNSNMAFTAGSNEQWIFQMNLQASFNTTADTKWQMVAPSGATCDITYSDIENASAIFFTGCNVSTGIVVIVSTDTSIHYLIVGYVTTGATAGTFQLQHGQNSASGTNTIFAGSTLRAHKISGADLAEYYYSAKGYIDAGTVVAADPLLGAGVKPTDKTYDNAVVGVVSTKPGLVLGDGADFQGGTPVPLALSGRVPVKVSTENGPIRPGDMLTSSSTPGVAMRATKAGAVIGQALTGYDGEGISKIIVFVKNAYGQGTTDQLVEGLAPADPDFSQLILSKLMTTNTSNPITNSEILTDRVVAEKEVISPKILADQVLTNSILANYATIALDLTVAGSLYANGGLTVHGAANFQGETVFHKMARFVDKVIFRNNVQFEGEASFNSDTGGLATIHKDQQDVVVKFSKPRQVPPIITVSIKNGKFVKYAYKELTAEGFKIVLEEPATEDIEFAWIALGVNNAVTHEIPLPPEDHQ